MRAASLHKSIQCVGTVSLYTSMFPSCLIDTVSSAVLSLLFPQLGFLGHEAWGPCCCVVLVCVLSVSLFHTHTHTHTSSHALCVSVSVSVSVSPSLPPLDPPQRPLLRGPVPLHFDCAFVYKCFSRAPLVLIAAVNRGSLRPAHRKPRATSAVRWHCAN